MTTLSFTVLGKPEPAGSKRAFVVRKGGVPTGQVVVSDANRKAKGWQQEVREVARQALMDAHDGDRFAPLLSEPLVLRVRFYRARPASHYGTGRNAATLKPSAPMYPSTRPDVDKLSRAVLDALSGCVYNDDAQIVIKTASKRYGVPERCEVGLMTLSLLPCPTTED